MEYLLYYLILINAATFLLMRCDKQKAQRRQWRIPEATLLGLGLLGGSLGGTLGMLCFSHKTKKPAFSVGYPVMLFLHIGLLLWFLL